MYVEGILQVRLNRLPLPYPDPTDTGFRTVRWPAIIAIVIAIVAAIFTAYCCLRCCGICGGRRRRGGRNRATTQPSMFNPIPYQAQGYQPANQPPPPQYAQFDAPSHSYGAPGKVGADSLPAMPSWEQARSRKVEEAGLEDMEMGKIHGEGKGPPMANASSADLSHPRPPMEHQHAAASPYTGPDFGVTPGHAQDTSYGGAAHTGYTGPDFGVGKPAYAAYPGSESTRYEPSRVNEPQELGTTYSNTLPPPSPGAHQQTFGQAPSVLQAGRRPEGHGEQGWRDV